MDRERACLFKMWTAAAFDYMCIYGTWQPTPRKICKLFWRILLTLSLCMAEQYLYMYAVKKVSWPAKRLSICLFLLSKWDYWLVPQLVINTPVCLSWWICWKQVVWRPFALPSSTPYSLKEWLVHSRAMSHSWGNVYYFFFLFGTFSFFPRALKCRNIIQRTCWIRTRIHFRSRLYGTPSHTPDIVLLADLVYWKEVTTSACWKPWFSFNSMCTNDNL